MTNQERQIVEEEERKWAKAVADGVPGDSAHISADNAARLAYVSGASATEISAAAAKAGADTAQKTG